MNREPAAGDRIHEKPSPRTRRDKALFIVRTLREAGFETVVVGGAVRDIVMGETPRDFDIATRAEPAQVEKLFRRTIGVGRQFGVVLVRLGKDVFEVATFRKDLDYSDGRRPEGVVFTTPKEDVLRRDFTINGMFWRPETDEIVDYVGGREDVRRKLVRCIGNPRDRFAEDHLRLLRAIRFASNLDFEIETETWKAVCDPAFTLKGVSIERIRIEFEKILVRPHAARGIRLLLESRRGGRMLCPDVLPETAPCPPLLDALLSHAVEIPLPRALALLYLSCETIGRFDPSKRSLRLRPGWMHKRERLRRFLKNMTFSRKTVEETVTVLHGALLLACAHENPRRSLLRKLAGRESGGETAAIVRTLHKALPGGLAVMKKLEEMFKLYQGKPVLPEPVLTGADLLSRGLEPGPAYSRILKTAYDIQLEGNITDRNELIRILKDKGIL
jgi:poly(A) polymerase